jgi:hypothetical protein
MTLRLNGSTSGYVEIDAPAVAGDNTLALPSTPNGSLVALDSSGRLGIGTSSPSNPIHVTNSSSSVATAYFNNTSTGGDSPSLIVQGGANNANTVGTFEVRDYSGNTDFKVQGDGKVGIGTTSPSRLLHLSAADSTSFNSADFDQTYNFLRIVNTTNDKAAGIYFGIGTNGEAAITAAETTDGETALVFGTRGGGTRSERARLDHAGRLLVGTASTLAQGEVIQGAGSNESLGLMRFRNDSAGPEINLYKTRATSVAHSVVSNGDYLGSVNFRGSDGTNYLVGARIDAIVDATPGSTDLPS